MATVSRFFFRLALGPVLLVVPSSARGGQALCTVDAGAGMAVLEGSVLDAETGFPLQGAEVRVSWTAAGDELERKTETDGSGTFRFCDVPSGTSVTAFALWFGERSESRQATLAGERTHLDLEVKSPHLTVTGHVRQDGTDEPVTAAAVRIGAASEVLTGEDGAFLVEKIPPGYHAVTAARIGFLTVRDSVTIDLGTRVDLEIRLSTEAVPLDPIEVTVRSEVLERTGFYDREGRGLGTFVTRADIEERPAVHSSDILRRISGVRLVRDRFGGWLAMGRGNCPFRFYIDGTRINPGFSIDEMPPHWIEGIEIYHLSQVPIQFMGSPMDPNANCGVIVVWTRNRR